MFNRLVASGGERARSWSTSAAGASVLVHLALCAGAVWASNRAADALVEAPEEEVTFVEIEEQAPEQPEPPEPPPPPPPEAPSTAPPPPQGFQELLPPEMPPPEIPEVDLTQQVARPEDFTGIGQAGGAASGVEGGVPTNTVPEDSTPVFTLEETGAKPELANLREAQRILERNYPQRHLDAGIAGQVQVKFMIDSDGKVAPGTVTVVNASHADFGEAAVKSVERFRFKPVVYRGVPVRVWATMPIGFKPAN